MKPTKTLHPLYFPTNQRCHTCQLLKVASAMQKCIRRGLERDALFWATELDRSNFGEYVFKRLRIIASEDIGPADTLTALLVRTLYENWKDQRKKDDSHHAPVSPR